MFWKRKDSDQKLAGPKDIPDFVKKQIAPTAIDPDVMPFLKILIKAGDNGSKVSEYRIYDPSEAEAKELKVANYNTLNGNEDLILCEGTLDDSSKKVAVNVKRALPKYKLLTYDEILQQVESLKTEGDNIMIYTAAGTGAGGPLGRGAVIVKLNPTNNGKKSKKYGISGTRILNLKPVPNSEMHVFDSDKSKEVAKWIADAHKPRFC